MALPLDIWLLTQPASVCCTIFRTLITEVSDCKKEIWRDKDCA